MKSKKTNFSLLKTLTTDLSSILKTQSVKHVTTNHIQSKQMKNFAPHHFKTNSICPNHINFITTDVFKNVPKQSTKSSEHTNALDQTKISSDISTTTSKRNMICKKGINILQSKAHKNYMKNFVLRLNKSLNKDKKKTNFITKGNNSLNNSHNLTTLSNHYNNTDININTSDKKSKKNKLSKVNSNNNIINKSNMTNIKKLENSKSVSEQLLKDVKIVNNVVDNNCFKLEKSSGSIISEESAFSSKQHSICNTHNSSSLKALSNKHSSNNTSSLYDDEYVSYTVSDDEVTCRSKMNINKMNFQNNNKDQIRAMNKNINIEDFNSFCQEMNSMLFSKNKK